MIIQRDGKTEICQMSLRSRSWLGWYRWPLAVLLVALMLSPLHFLHFEDSESQLRDADEELASVVFVPSRGSAMSRDLKNLYQWLDVASPEAGAHPDYSAGFSRYAYYKDATSGKTQYPEIQGETLIVEEPVAAPRGNYASSDVMPRVGEIVTQNWEYSGKVATSIPPAPLAPAGLYLRLESGELISGLPPVPEEILWHLNNEAKITGIGRLELIPSVSGFAPRLVLRESCGDVRLDRYAVDAVYDLLGNAGAQLVKAGRCIVEIDWRRNAAK